MTVVDWRDGPARSLAVQLNGDAITEPGPRGEAITDQSFLLLFNAGDQPVSFTLPDPSVAAGTWQVVVRTPRTRRESDPTWGGSRQWARRACRMSLATGGTNDPLKPGSTSATCRWPGRRRPARHR